MDKLELRARARATARASGLFEVGHERVDAAATETRGRSSAAKSRPAAPPPIDAIDETQARAACKPMGELECIVQAADAAGRQRTLYVIVPDLTKKVHYQRLGFVVEPGCRVLLDARALLPLAVLRLSGRSGERMPASGVAAAGFNPYFDLPHA